MYHPTPDIYTDIGKLSLAISALRKGVDKQEQEQIADLLQEIYDHLPAMGDELQRYRQADLQASIMSQSGDPDIILPIELPQELDGPNQRKMMKRSLDYGLIRAENGIYQFNRILTGSQQAYWCQQIFTPIDASAFPAQAVEQMFGIKNVSVKISKLLNNKCAKPRGWEDVDRVLAI